MAVPHSIPKSILRSGRTSAISSANLSKNVSNPAIGGVSLNYCPRAAILPLQPRNRTTPATLPKLRRCTMGYNRPWVNRNYATARGLRPEPAFVPYLRLRGHWLHRAGFAIGTRVRILVTPRRLVLEVDENPDRHNGEERSSHRA